MRFVFRIGLLAVWAVLLFALPVQAQQTAAVTGVVSDMQTGETLPGASVTLRVPGTTNMVAGAATDAQGRYRFDAVPVGDYELAVSYVGYSQEVVPISLAPGEVETADVALQQGGFDLNTIVVTASRQQEKVLDAPASISVLTPREIMDEVTPSSVSVLRNTTGVDLAQTGVDRHEVVLRGFNNAFSGATYVLTDYRQAAVPSLGVNVYSIMPNMPIDLERIEVVRGPGSALYGAGVDAGVIHFITKDPFTYPGTTVAVMGGERSFFGGQLRHAGVVGSRLGYKITGAYSQAEDWGLEADQTTGFTVPQEDDFQKVNVNGLLQYRFGERTSLTAQGGYSSLTATVLSGIGTLQADNFGYTYGQLRLEAGDFFAQAYVNRNDAGDSFVYGTGNTVVDHGLLYNAQAQYDLRLGDRQQFILGADADMTRPDTEGTILGRNEEDDTIVELGAYVQSTTNITPKLDFTAALRADHNNIIEEVVLSPRAAVVFKPSLTHTLRATYNRAFSSPGTNSLFLDIRAQETTLVEGLPFQLVFQGRGAAEGFTFADFRTSNTAAFSLPVPNLFGQPVPVGGVPLQPVYGVAAAQIGALLRSPAPLPAPLTGLPPEQRATLAAIIESLTPAIPVTAATEGVLGVPDASQLGYRVVEGPVDIEPLRQTTTQTFELGYKGLIGERLLFTVDGYYSQKENFVGPLLVESPLVFVPELGTDLAQTLGPIIAGAAAQDPQLDAFLQSLGLSPAAAAGLLGQLAGAGFNTPGDAVPVAVVQPDQPVLASPNPTTVGGFLSYRNFGQVQYYGVDVSAQLLLSNSFDVFGSVSWVSDNLFDNEELEEENVALSVALNAPALKVKGGATYRHPAGASLSVSSRYTEGFPVRSGPYQGRVEDYFLLDVGAGYDFSRVVPGLQFEVTVQNVLDNEHREFVGAPDIGRMALARLVYSM